MSENDIKQQDEKDYSHNNPLAGPKGELDIHGILETLPHRYPFLLVDKILEVARNDKIIGLKNVTFNEPFFEGHFPEDPVMPGVMIIEAMAQVAALFVAHTEFGGKTDGLGVFFVAIDKARFRKPVIPGDSLIIEAKHLRNRGGIWRFDCIATCDGKTCASATLTAMVFDKKEAAAKAKAEKEKNQK